MSLYRTKIHSDTNKLITDKGKVISRKKIYQERPSQSFSYRNQYSTFEEVSRAAKRNMGSLILLPPTGDMISEDILSPITESREKLAYFMKLVNTCVGSFLEQKYFDQPVFKYYMKCREESKQYRKLATYKETAEKLCREKVQKNLTKHLSKKTLVLGLEEVLVVMESVPFENYDICLELYQGEIPLGEVFIKLRPYIFEFLEYVSEKYELIVFCNGEPHICDRILDYIESHQKYFDHRFYNSHCLFQNSKFCVKFYDHLFDQTRSAENVVIVDSSISAFCLHLSNGVPVAPFLSDSRYLDRELIHLAHFLDELYKAPSVDAAINFQIEHSLLRYSQITEIGSKSNDCT